MITSGNNKIVIYTVLVGNYDKLCQPKKIIEGVDYVCFTDKEGCNERIGVWQVFRVPFSHKDNGRESRYPKIMPHKTVLSEYDYSLYIDANLIIKDDYVYQRIEEFVKNETKLALIKHPARDCAYQEAYNCIAGCKAKWRDLIRQIMFLKRKGFPEHWGLFEANVIFRKHNNESVKELDELWWSTFMKYSKRDQLSLAYSLWTTNIDYSFFLPEQYSTLNHPSFERLEHLPQKDSRPVKFKKWLVSLVIKSAKSHLKDPIKE